MLIPPADAAPEQLAAAPKHVKVTVYMPAELVADLDAMRADLLRLGQRADRGMVMRAAIAMGKENPTEWGSRVMREAS